MDAFLHADPPWIAAQRRRNRDRSQPIVTPRTIVADLGDPRTVPFDARKASRGFIAVTILQAVVCFGFVACFWWALV